uniref:Uncharacterized protein n=1 Tax=Nelumbo nucifera TaxID=4432 RepID=A0A822ZIF3_NELNU|nr:TPA_asm: hypothetical protein HUJ06_004124 [Nelumbo nucifera]
MKIIIDFLFQGFIIIFVCLFGFWMEICRSL